MTRLLQAVCVLLLGISKVVSLNLAQNKPSSSSAISRRSWLAGASLLAAPGMVLAKDPGAPAKFGVPDAETQEMMRGGKGDMWGDDSRQNGIYATQQKKVYGTNVAPGVGSGANNGAMAVKGSVDKKLLAARVDDLKGSRARLAAKVEPALAKGKWPAVVDACNSELYQFKQYLSVATKMAQGGQVCLVDASQRGINMPKGMDPSDCPLQLIQVAILQDVNDVYLYASKKDVDKSAECFAKFQVDFDAFAAAVAKL